MTRDETNAFCATLKSAECSSPFGPGHDVWKVGGKIFAIIGALQDGVAFKTRDIESASMLIAEGLARKAPYLHRSWAMVPFGTHETAMPDDELAARIKQSYAIIFASLPRKTQASISENQT
jgi:predicted DNA-binding protein (MmcQ/YjbR family)